VLNVSFIIIQAQVPLLLDIIALAIQQGYSSAIASRSRHLLSTARSYVGLLRRPIHAQNILMDQTVGWLYQSPIRISMLPCRPRHFQSLDHPRLHHLVGALCRIFAGISAWPSGQRFWRSVWRLCHFATFPIIFILPSWATELAFRISNLTLFGPVQLQRHPAWTFARRLQPVVLVPEARGPCSHTYRAITGPSSMLGTPSLCPFDSISYPPPISSNCSGSAGIAHHYH
jgi:hypothetical protein